jgi:hypothetical protein
VSKRLKLGAAVPRRLMLDSLLGEGLRRAGYMG